MPESDGEMSADLRKKLHEAFRKFLLTTHHECPASSSCRCTGMSALIDTIPDAPSLTPGYCLQHGEHDECGPIESPDAPEPLKNFSLGACRGIRDSIAALQTLLNETMKDNDVKSDAPEPHDPECGCKGRGWYRCGGTYQDEAPPAPEPLPSEVEELSAEFHVKPASGVRNEQVD
jgi:hypothetical protein